MDVTEVARRPTIAEWIEIGREVGCYLGYGKGPFNRPQRKDIITTMRQGMVLFENPPHKAKPDAVPR